MVEVLLVVGGTGDLGGRVVRILRERGEDVRCTVRPGSDGTALRELGVEVVPGDLTAPDTLAAACRGADTVVATATAMGRRLADRRSPSIREVDEIGMAALVDAAEANGVQRFVHVSFVASDSSLGTPLERAKIATEQRLGRSPMRTTVVRSDAFQELHLGPLARFDVAAGKVAIIGRGDSRRRYVATGDVAALVAALALEDDPPALVEVGGPEALSKNEAVAVAEAATGRRFRVQHLPRPVARLAVRVLNHTNDGLASAFGAGLLQDEQGATWDDRAFRDRGIEARPASDFIREQARGPAGPET